VASFARISRSVATEQAYRSCDLIEMASRAVTITTASAQGAKSGACETIYSRPESVSWRVRE